MPAPPPTAEPPRWTAPLRFLANLIFPGVCQLCHHPAPSGRHLCTTCEDALPPLRPPFCASCGEMFDGALDRPFECPNCHTLDFAFDFARPAMALDPRTRQLIHDLKYHRAIHLAADLARLTRRAFDDDPRLHQPLAERWPLVPVPLHWHRTRTRHFNQAAEIARALSRSTRCPLVHALRRTRTTTTQTRLSRHQRQQNLHHAFSTTRHFHHLTRHPGVILIDDVLTTGSTVHECARTLRLAGSQKVIVVTVMRG